MGLRHHMFLIIISTGTTYMFLFSGGPTIRPKHTCMYARDIPVSTVVIKTNTTRILLAQTPQTLPLFEITILNVTF